MTAIAIAVTKTSLDMNERRRSSVLYLKRRRDRRQRNEGDAMSYLFHDYINAYIVRYLQLFVPETG